jgi:hypothetical protein
MAIRDLAQYLRMDITLGSVGTPPNLEVRVQKCTDSGDPDQAAVCSTYTTGCNPPCKGGFDQPNKICGCQPGAVPYFHVSFTNPYDNPVPTNPADPNGGWHFKLTLVGDGQYLLDEVPVYIVPSDVMVPEPPSDDGAGAFQESGSYEQQVYGAGCNYYQLEGEAPGAGACTDGMDNDGDMLTDGDDPDCQPGSCLDGVDNDGDGDGDLLDEQCTTNEVQDWDELYFQADIPEGTALLFDVCTADTIAELDACSYSRIARVTSSGGSCTLDVDCLGVNVDGVIRDGFCGAGGQCQFIEPQRVSGFCLDDSQCLNGTFNGTNVASTCDPGLNQCVYSTPPADLGNNLPTGENGKPYAKVRIGLEANTIASESPVLYEWYLTYRCRSLN